MAVAKGGTGEFGPRYGIERRAQILRDFFRLHHAGAAFGKRRLLAGFGLQPAEFVDGVAQPFGLACGPLDGGAVIGHRDLARAALAPQRRHFGGLVLDAPIGIEQGAMGRGIDEGAVVMLAVDFNERRAERAQHLHADRLVVDESAGAAVGELHAPHDQFLFAAEHPR